MRNCHDLNRPDMCSTLASVEARFPFSKEVHKRLTREGRQITRIGRTKYACIHNAIDVDEQVGAGRSDSSQ